MIKEQIGKVTVLQQSIQQLFDDSTKTVNSLATDMYNTLGSINTQLSEVKDKVSILGDMLTDLRVLNGSAKNIIYLNYLNIVENQGIKINNNSFELDLVNKDLREIDTNLTSISSMSNYVLTDLNGKQAYLDTSLKTGSDLVIEFPTTSYTFNLNLRYQNLEQINTIVLSLGLLTESYPDILSIKYLDKDSVLKDVIILNTNSKNYSLDENRVKNNDYVLNINPIVTNQIIIELSSRDYKSVILKKIETYYSTILDEGYILLGPIQTEDPILKLAIDSKTITKGITLEVSTDRDYWLNISNSSSISLTDANKVISINTINENSIKTDTDVYTLYFRIKIKSEILSNEDLNISVYNTYREDLVIGNDTLGLIETNKISAYRVRDSDFIYGKYIYSNTSNLSTFPLDRVEYIENNGVLKVLGLIDTKYSITNSNNSSNMIGSIGSELKLKRLPALATTDAREFDVANCKLYDIYPRYIEETINIKQKDNLCLMLKTSQVAEDMYTIIGKQSKKSIKLDLTTPFTFNSISTIVNVFYEDIIIKNSIGEILAEVKKEDLLTIIEEEKGIVEPVTYYFLNLVDILFNPIQIEGYTYSKLYPLKELEETEYALLNGKIVTGKDVIIRIKGYELLKDNVEINRIVNYYNGNYIKRFDENFTYHHQQIESNSFLKSIIKLDNVSIERGSLYLEEYISGSEQYESVESTNLKYLNVNTESDPKYLETETDQYLQE